jgi:hypothetical protein
MLALLFVLGCGSAQQGEPCLTTGECANELVCIGPDAEQVCGIPGLSECVDSSTCPGDEMCHAVRDPCSSGQTGFVCDVGCPITPCEDDFACSQGACVPRPCDGLPDDRFVCPSPLVCDPVAAQATASGPFWTHGCVEVGCSDDEGCTDGLACVNGVCQTGPGTCRADEPVP